MNLFRAFTAIVFGCLVMLSPLAAEEAARDQDLLNEGKVLMIDRKCDEARTVFQRVIQEFPRSRLVSQAYYFTARCLQLQGKEVEALLAYEQFLEKYPNEPYFPDESRNAVVELAASLHEKGKTDYKNRVVSGLSSAKKEVRYFSAIRSSYLNDAKITGMAIPILREIIQKETERDLVDRARIALLRLEPNGVQQQAEAPANRQTAKMFHILIQKSGAKEPTVELNLPLGLAQLAIMALDDSKKEELRRKGFDVDNIWNALQRLGPTNILTFRDGNDLVKIWIE
jgi:tetratricopeptide (TPR) repeat protein